jgi:hypothetical protein
MNDDPKWTKLIGWRLIFPLFLLLWMVLSFAFAPPLPPPAHPKAVTRQSDTMVCAEMDDRLYGADSDNAKQLAATIIATYNDVVDTPIAPVTLARAQIALLNYCQIHPVATLREAVEATWRTL